MTDVPQGSPPRHALNGALGRDMPTLAPSNYTYSRNYATSLIDVMSFLFFSFPTQANKSTQLPPTFPWPRPFTMLHPSYWTSRRKSGWQGFQRWFILPHRPVGSEKVSLSLSGNCQACTCGSAQHFRMKDFWLRCGAASRTSLVAGDVKLVMRRGCACLLQIYKSCIALFF